MDFIVGGGRCALGFHPEGAFSVTGRRNVLGHMTTDADELCVGHTPSVTLTLWFPRGKWLYFCDFCVPYSSFGN